MTVAEPIAVPQPIVLEKTMVPAYCFQMDADTTSQLTHITLEAIHAHNTLDQVSKETAEDFTFGTEEIEFATNNCASYHICIHLYLFIDPSNCTTEIKIIGIGNKTVAAGIGSIKITLTDEEGADHEKILRNIIYLPDTPKNLISIHRCGMDNKDNCEIFTCPDHSIFFWDHDASKKIIQHPSNCPISIMQVNKGDNNKLDSFIQTNKL